MAWTGLRLGLAGLLAMALAGGDLAGRVTDGTRGLPGVRIYADRQPRVGASTPPPVATTDA